MRRTLPFTALLLLAAAPLAAQGGADSTAARLAAGKRIFEGKGLCWSCHGKAGEGALGPTTALVGKAWLHSKGTLPEIVALVKSGLDAEKTKVGSAMPPKGGSRITDAEVEQVAAYVLSLRERKAGS